MKRSLFLFIAVALLAFGNFAYATTMTDNIQYPASQFVDPANPMGNYRWYNQDWGWQHHAISGTFTSATLNISAWDVDNKGPAAMWEHDLIYAYDNGVKTLLGELQGADSSWAYTTFSLGSNFFDDIQSGLDVWIDIDTTTNGNWAVSLAKSVLSLDGAPLPNPNPTVNSSVPEPSFLLLFGAGLAGLGSMKKRFTK